MCGIAGWAGDEPSPSTLNAMLQVLEHRGPDDVGTHAFPHASLGARRLAVIDVAGGHQPMSSPDGFVSVVLNGEIFNHVELRTSLERRGLRFRSHCDTEVVLRLFEQHGLDCVGHMRGMFAFAAYDSRANRLVLGRDRLGVKPLYYWSHDGRLVFASELKAILEFPGFSPEPFLESVDAYLSMRYVPGPSTLLAGVRKLPAGCTLTWQDGQTLLKRYWEPACDFTATADEEYDEAFADLFEESVRLRLASDVPLGAYVSGGVDSAAVLLAARNIGGRPLDTFSVGFEWKGDESGAAASLSSELDCTHHPVHCSSADFDYLREIVWHLDEPVGDPIVVPMFALSRATKPLATVVLTGDGADEMLAGYLPLKVMHWMRTYRNRVPSSVRTLVRSLAPALPAIAMNAFFDHPGTMAERGKRKVLDYLKTVETADSSREYHFLISLFDERDKQNLYTKALAPYRWDAPNGAPDDGALEQLLALQFLHWLPDDILTKQDKITMAHGIEARVPFLDHKLVEFLTSVPASLKLRGRQDKVLLRRYVGTHLGRRWANRRKRAFYLPLDRFIEGSPLRDIVRDCLSPRAVSDRGLFDVGAVGRLLERSTSGDFLHARQVFSLTMLELWYRIYIDGESRT